MSKIVEVLVEEGFTICFQAIEEERTLREILKDSGESERQIESQVEDLEGNTEIFIAKVSAWKDGIELASDFLGGCIYQFADEFYKKFYNDNFANMKKNVIAEAKEKIEKLTIKPNPKAAKKDKDAFPQTINKFGEIEHQELFPMLSESGEGFIGGYYYVSTMSDSVKFAEGEEKLRDEYCKEKEIYDEETPNWNELCDYDLDSFYYSEITEIEYQDECYNKEGKLFCWNEDRYIYEEYVSKEDVYSAMNLLLSVQGTLEDWYKDVDERGDDYQEIVEFLK